MWSLIDREINANIYIYIYRERERERFYNKVIKEERERFIKKQSRHYSDIIRTIRDDISDVKSTMDA